MMRRAFGITGLLVLISCSSAWAGAPTERLRTFFDEANRVLTAPETQANPLEALARVKRLVNEVFDFRGAAEQALGPAWHTRSRAERDEFVGLFADLLQKNFVGRVATKARMDGGLSVRYLDEQVEGDTAIVSTAIDARDGQALRLNFRMVKRWVRGWKVRDVALDGVGLLANYQAQFARVLQSGSYPELLAQMRAKAQPSPELLAQLAEPDELPPSAAPASVVAAPPAPVAPAPLRVPVFPATPPAAAPSTAVASAAASARVPAAASAPAAPTTRASAPAPQAPPAIAAAPVTMTALPALAAAPSPAPAAQAQPPAPAPPAPTPVAASPAPPQPEPAAPPAPPRTVSLPPVTPPSAEIAPPAPASAARRANAIVARAAHWVVQIGAYKSMEAATKIFAGIADPKVALEPGPGRMWRVFLGPFADKAAARLKAKELSARGYSTQIHEERK